jgi:hypothetical protein
MSVDSACEPSCESCEELTFLDLQLFLPLPLTGGDASGERPVLGQHKSC